MTSTTPVEKQQQYHHHRGITSGHITIVNKFILGFMKLNGATDEMIQLWSSRETQSKLKSSMAKARVNNVKRGKTVYICFCDEVRPQIFKEFPDMNIKDVTCELARRWREFKADPDEARMAELVRLSQESNARYHASKSLVNSVQLPKKKVNSAYLNFCKKQRELDSKITMKELGVLWKEAKASGEHDKYAVVDV